MEEIIPAADEAADEDDAVAVDAAVEEEEDKEEGHRAQIMLIKAAVAPRRARNRTASTVIPTKMGSNALWLDPLFMKFVTFKACTLLFGAFN